MFDKGPLYWIGFAALIAVMYFTNMTLWEAAILALVVCIFNTLVEVRKDQNKKDDNK